MCNILNKTQHEMQWELYPQIPSSFQEISGSWLVKGCIILLTVQIILL